MLRNHYYIIEIPTYYNHTFGYHHPSKLQMSKLLVKCLDGRKSKVKILKDYDDVLNEDIFTLNGNYSYEVVEYISLEKVMAMQL